MRTHKASQKQSSTSNPLVSRPFVVQAQAETSTESPGTQGYESQMPDFAILNPDGGQTMPLQPKLAIGAPGDKYEQEADRMAKQVVQQINITQPIQAFPRQEMSLNPAPLQRKPMLQLQLNQGGMAVTSALESSIQKLRGHGQPLDQQLREPIEQAFNADFSRVRVHTDTQSDQLNQSIQAKAFTTGQDIFFSQGAYQPGSRGGQELIAHELTHVVQQNSNTVPTIQGNLMIQRSSKDNDGIEQKFTDEAIARHKLMIAWEEIEFELKQLELSGFNSSGIFTPDPSQYYQGNFDEEYIVSDDEPQNYTGNFDEEYIVSDDEPQNYMGNFDEEDIVSDDEPQNYQGELLTQTIFILTSEGWQQHQIPLPQLFQAIAQLQQQGIQFVIPQTQKNDMEDDSMLMTKPESQTDSQFPFYTTSNFSSPVVTTIQRKATASGYGGGYMDNTAKKKLKGNVSNPAGNITPSWKGKTGQNTSIGVDAEDLHRQSTGGGVGKTRPNDWIDFIAMVGATNPFKQGHTLHEDLGGYGTHDNLSPFTSSLNGLHYNRVEYYVLAQTGKKAQDEFADYAVDVNYKGNTDISDWAKDEFDNMSLKDQVSAMKNAGLINKKTAAAIIKAKVMDAVNETIAHNWLENYVNDTFPSDIDCDAVFIEDDTKGGYISTAQQVVNITNEF